MELLKEILGFGNRPKFEPGTFVVRVTDGQQLYYKIINVEDGNYIASIPQIINGTFSGWSPPRSIPLKFIDRNCELVSPDLANRFDKARKGQSAKLIFQ